MYKKIETGNTVVVILSEKQLTEIGIKLQANMGQEFKVLDVSPCGGKILTYWGWTDIRAFRLVNPNKWSIYNNTIKWHKLGNQQKRSLLFAGYNGHKFSIDGYKNTLFLNPKFDNPEGVYTVFVDSGKVYNVFKPDNANRILLSDIERYKSVCAAKDTVCAAKDREIDALYRALIKKNVDNNALISKGKTNSHAVSIARGLIDRNSELERVLKLVHYDLLLRAEEDSDGVKVVDVGSSVWASLKGAIGLA
jgi:hypothetical protein